MKRTEHDKRISVDVSVADELLGAASPEQRSWLIHRAVYELRSELAHLDAVARHLVPGSWRPKINSDWSAEPAVYEDAGLQIAGQQVMQAWETPLMVAMAEAITRKGGSILEIGFGMGISATAIQAAGAARHVIVEANSQVGQAFERWRDQHARGAVEMVFGRWQDVEASLGTFDGIFFDTYPLNETEWHQHVRGDATYAEHFFAAAARHLASDGVFTYFTCEIDTIGRPHQRALFKHFEEFSVRIIDGLKPPPDCNYWWAPSMAMVVARGPRG